MKILLTVCGWLFVVLASIGVFLPLLPTVPFVLLAAACFARSSPRFHRWLLEHRVFGVLISHWQTTRSIPKRSKYIAIATILTSGAVSLFMIEIFAVKIALIVLLSIPIIILIRLPNSEDWIKSKS